MLKCTLIKILFCDLIWYSLKYMNQKRIIHIFLSRVFHYNLSTILNVAILQVFIWNIYKYLSTVELWGWCFPRRAQRHVVIHVDVRYWIQWWQVYTVGNKQCQNVHRNSSNHSRSIRSTLSICTLNMFQSVVFSPKYGLIHRRASVKCWHIYWITALV